MRWGRVGDCYSYGLCVSEGIGPFWHADWTSVDRLHPGKTPGLLNRGGSKGLGRQGLSHCRMTRVSLALKVPKAESPYMVAIGRAG